MKKRTIIRIISYCACAVIAMGVFSWIHYNKSRNFERFLSASYQHAFSELVNSVSGIDSALQKSLYATSPSLAAPLCTEVFGKAMTAQMSLGVLPCSTINLEQTAGFVSKVGDYAYSLARNASKGTAYTKEERENLKTLSETATILSQNLNQLMADMDQGYLTMDDLAGAEKLMDLTESDMLPKTVGGSLRLIEEEFPEIPSLIYDGPFSKHLIGANPKQLEGLRPCTENDARAIVSKALGIAQGKVVPTGVCEGDIPAYCMDAKIDGGGLSAEVSKTGGKLMGLIGSRKPASSDISIEKAIDNAKGFLERNGFESMTESYYIIQDNIATINFAYSQDGIVCYPDLVKVSIAMDNGSVIGLEAKGYISNHYQREMPEIQVDVETAQARVPEDLTVLSKQTALIPTMGQYEVLCHEFTCQNEDESHYIIYVNATTGEQEKILILIEDESGALTL